jgi:hypothetical protein
MNKTEIKLFEKILGELWFVHNTTFDLLRELSSLKDQILNREEESK